MFELIFILICKCTARVNKMFLRSFMQNTRDEMQFDHVSFSIRLFNTCKILVLFE